ncbi:triple tyrosine motif-containing protein [Granulicella cerasi]|uniref:Triple tyrosine motif-containing protein n=1 Tax=Granulicella cerasi TaxID=741063 RepID=A0ABW1ZAI6_9BACT|nr:sensor histidine kinase [Granulicella cerasi]
MLRLVNGQWQNAEETKGLGIQNAYRLYEDSRHTLWMATDNLVYRLPSGAHTFLPTRMHPGPNGQFMETPDGIVWMADQYGLHDVNDELAAKPHVPLIDVPLDLIVDDSGALWFLGEHTGITRIPHLKEVAALPAAQQKKVTENFSAINGLTSEVTSKALKDREGNLWVATVNGLDRFRRTALQPAPLPDKFYNFALAPEPDGSILVGTLPFGVQRLANGQITKVPTGKRFEISCLYRAPDGKVWVGGTGSLGYLERGVYKDIPLPVEVTKPELGTVQSITEAANGDLWVQPMTGRGIYILHDGKWSVIPNTTDKRPAVVMRTDGAGRVWAGYITGFLTIFDGVKRTTFGSEQGFMLGSVLALQPSKDGMWIGGRHGLELMAGDHPVPLKFAGDTKIEGISGIMRVDDGSLWLNSLAGILRVPSAEVEQTLKDPSHPMSYRLFDYHDGVWAKPPQIRPMPSTLRGVGTTLWFTTTDGVLSIDTAHIDSNRLVPSLAIRRILVDDKELDPESSITLAKGAKDLQIDYTALSLSIPERVYFRYKLEGYDKDWQEAGPRRQAFYTHLPPGHYVFRVIACNNDGLWNETGTSLAIYLPPTFLQSWTFKTLLIVFFLAAAWVIYLLRMARETASMRARMVERFSERERIARDLHDTLFQSVEGATLVISSLSSRLPMEAPERDRMDGALQEISRVMGSTRSLIFEQSKMVECPDLEGMLVAYRGQLELLSNDHFRLVVEGTSREIRPAVCDEAFKIIRESLTNAFRHTKATDVQVSVSYTAKALVIAISDNGAGIDAAIVEAGGKSGHWGIPGMRQRASELGGELKIRRRDEGGTEVRLEVRASRAFRSRTGQMLERWFDWKNRTPGQTA